MSTATTLRSGRARQRRIQRRTVIHLVLLLSTLVPLVCLHPDRLLAWYYTLQLDGNPELAFRFAVKPPGTPEKTSLFRFMRTKRGQGFFPAVARDARYTSGNLVCRVHNHHFRVDIVPASSICVSYTDEYLELSRLNPFDNGEYVSMPGDISLVVTHYCDACRTAINEGLARR